MAEYNDREAAIEAIADRFERIGDDMRAASIRSKTSILRWIPAADVVSRDCHDKILWENGIMRRQLALLEGIMATYESNVATKSGEINSPRCPVCGAFMGNETAIS